MTWADWRRAQLHGLRAELRAHYRTLADARAAWVRVGLPPADPLRAELERSMAQTAALGEVVGERLRVLDGEAADAARSRWTGVGWNAKLRPSLRGKGESPGPR